MKWLITWSIVLLVVVAGLSTSTLTYHATCANCLAQGRGREISVLGVTVHRVLNIGPNSDYPDLPSDGSAAYQRIMEQACPHQFKRGGMGCSSFGMIACGKYPDERAFGSRIQAIQALFRVFKRIDDLDLARKSLHWIDSQLKSDADLRKALNYVGGELGPNHLAEFARLMKSVNSEAEWGSILDHEEAGFSELQPAPSSSK